MSQLHILAKQISDYKIILGFAVIFFGTLGNLAFGAINYTVSIRNAPIVRRVEAIEFEQQFISQTLGNLKDNNDKQFSDIHTKLDQLLFKLIPNSSGR